ncbi:MAG: ComF family protein [Caldisericaceae bacterium]
MVERAGNVTVFAITAYEGVMEDAIKKFKFKNNKILSEEFAEIIVQFIASQSISADYVGFVPMTRRELLKRSFNQTELLATTVSKSIGAKPFYGIQKIRDTKRQLGLKKSERLSNLANAFALGENVKGDVIIIDDVYTTGTTANEILKVLRKKVSGNISFIALSKVVS